MVQTMQDESREFEDKPVGRENVQNGPIRATRSHAIGPVLVCVCASVCLSASRSVGIKRREQTGRCGCGSRVAASPRARKSRPRAQARTRDAGVRRSRVPA